MASDARGNVYVADYSNHTIRRITPAGYVTTFAGSPQERGATDGVRGAARFNSPSDVAVDRAGNIWVADSGNSVIRRITPDGVVTTAYGMAGSAEGLDGSGNSARFIYPAGLAFHTDGVLYITDSNDQTIRCVSPDGFVSTLCGTRGVSGARDGQGISAQFSGPSGLAVDSDGTLYVSDSRFHIIRKITQGAQVTTLAGTAWEFGGSRDGTGPAAKFSSPGGIEVDSAGNIYVADSGNQTIRKVTRAGVVTTFVGASGLAGYADGVGSAARLWRPQGICLGPDGRLLVSEWNNSSVRHLTVEGRIDTWAGGPLASGSTNGKGTAARFSGPAGLAVSSSGTIFVADRENSVIRQITPDGQVSTFAGGAPGYSNGAGVSAQFFRPAALAVNASGNVYVADTDNRVIRKITPAGGVTKLAGIPGSLGSNDGTGNSARFMTLNGIAADDAGNVYVTDSNVYRIRRVNAAGVVSTLSGNASIGIPMDGSASSASFGNLGGISINGAAELFVTDSDSVRRVTMTGQVTTIAGDPYFRATDDGVGPAARFFSPRGIAFAPDGSAWVVDSLSARIRRVTPGGATTTPGSDLRMNMPEGVAVAQDGTVYVADTGRHRILRGVPDRTRPPVLLSPSNGSRNGRHVRLAYELPEAALSGTLAVEFRGPVIRTLRLSFLEEHAGIHEFTFDAENPVAGLEVKAIEGGPVLPYGTYQVFLRYQDLAGNAVAESIMENVTIGIPDIALNAGPDITAPQIISGQTEAVEYGRNIQGTPHIQNFTITNAGSAELIVGKIALPSGYTFIGAPELPLILPPASSNVVRIGLTSLAAGPHAGKVIITSNDPDESIFEFSLKGEVYIPDPVVTQLNTPGAPNRQTGLREQIIRLTNNTTATVPVCNLLIRGLPPGVEINNASAVRPDGTAVVYVRQGIEPFSSLDLRIEYFSRDRRALPGVLEFNAEVVMTPEDLTVPEGAGGLAIENIIRQKDGGVLLEFASVPGRQYEVQYSADGVGWELSRPQIRAVSTRTQWLDQGLPRTAAHPAQAPSRFYRVREVQP